MKKFLHYEQVAGICHEANRYIQYLLKEDQNESWENVSNHIHESAEDGVLSALEGMTPEQLHHNWLVFKTHAGWVWGEVKDEEKKTHPCMLPYEELPENQRLKDRVFFAIVNACKENINL